MTITIDDNLPSHERQRLLELLPLVYALEKFNGNKKRASTWLGISSRGIRLKVLQFPELHKYYIAPPTRGRYTK